MNQVEHRQKINKIVENNKQEILKMYVEKKYPATKIAKIFGLTNYFIGEFLRKQGIETYQHYTNKYPIDESYFEKIDNDEKAYWLGWLFSDGFIYDDYTIGINLNLKDREILEKFKKCLKSEVPITIRKNNVGFGNENSMISTFRFKNKKINTDLRQFGMKPRKSLTLEWPKIDDKYFYSFMRGYIEGDGCICIYNDKVNKNKDFKRFCLVVLGTKEFIKEMLKQMEKIEIGFSVRKAAHCEFTFHAATCNKINILKFLDKMYENHNGLYLDRKYQKYLQMKENFIKYPSQDKNVRNRTHKINFD